MLGVKKKQGRIKLLDFLSFISTVLWAAGRATSLYIFPVSTILLLCPFALSLASLVLNSTLAPNNRVHAYSFAYRMYWHPLCGFLVAISFIFLDAAVTFSDQSILLKVLGTMGIITIFAIFVWTFMQWLRSSRGTK